MKRTQSVIEAELEDTFEMMQRFRPKTAETQAQQDEKQIFKHEDLERTFSKMIRKAIRRAKQ